MPFARRRFPRPAPSSRASRASGAVLAVLGGALALAIAAATGCGTTGAPAEAERAGAPEPASGTDPGGPEAESDRVRTLVDLAQEALAAGDLDTAEDRFRRAARAGPAAARPRTGLARVALARGDLAGAESAAGQALERRPADADALLVRATVARERGEPEAARALLDRALLSEPEHLGVHGAREALTGLGPAEPPASLEEALARAAAHPYDPRAQLRAGRGLVEAGRAGEASAFLEASIFVADRGAGSAWQALRLLREHDPAWAARAVVPVHCWADETVRESPSWRMRLRLLWARGSNGLGGVLGTRFVPVSMAGFPSAGASDDLASIAARFEAALPTLPPRGIAAGFTARAPPRRPGFHRLGQATYLGRVVVARLGPKAERTLMHEILHLYGGIHVADDVASIMNAGGSAMGLDAANAEIVRLVRPRRFGPGGVEKNVLSRLDPRALADAMGRALALNLEFRRLGLLEAREEASLSRFSGARLARQAGALDEHLGDVARLLAMLRERQGRPAEAVVLLEGAAVLYGPRTPRGREIAARAAALRQAYGLGQGP